MHKHIGTKFGRLEVLSSEKGKHGLNFLCICECGTKKIIRATHVIAGVTKSCGCLCKEGVSQRKVRGYAGLTTVWIGYKKNAIVRNLPFFLTKEEFKNLSQQNCFYCGIPPSNSSAPYASSYKNSLKGNEAREHARFNYNGIDRVDNDLGYTLENCVACCKMCNFAKNKHSQKEFLEWLLKAFKHLENTNVIKRF